MMLDIPSHWCYSNSRLGGIAQLGERLNGIQEVSGSIPLISTNKNTGPNVRCFFVGGNGFEPLTSLFQSVVSVSLIEARSASISGSIPLISTK